MVAKLEGVSYVRNGKALLKDVNWEIQRGEHWVVLGLNGSGKTTLLKILSASLLPTKGEVTVLGERFGSYPLGELRKSIGWVSSSLHQQLHAYEYAENIILSGKYASIGLYDEPDQEDIDYALALMEELAITHLLHQPYEVLSQGERQKVLIARSLMARPQLLILDEPCSGLDVFAREQLLQTIERLGSKQDGPTLIYVTHHIEEIVPVFAHSLLLRDGEQYAAGRTDELLTEATLSRFFGLPVDVNHRHERYSLEIGK